MDYVSKRREDREVYVRVFSPDQAPRAEVEEWNRQGGYRVTHDGRLPETAPWAIVEVAHEVTLTERRYLHALVEHGESKAMARALCVGRKTVDATIGRLMEKFEVHSRVLLAVKVIQLGLVEI